jgi:hypothetical protein
MNQTAEPGGLTADEAFALVGHETRVDILRAVTEIAREAGDPDAAVSFSELRARVGERDSGKFNYHLGKLVGPFLDRVDGGYRLRYTTLLLVGAVTAGTYNTTGNAEPTVARAPCPVCGGAVEATYAADRTRVACAACERVFAAAALPPGALAGYEPADYPAVFDRWTSRLMADMRSGFCIACLGRVAARVADDTSAHYECERCPERATASLGEALLDHPALVAYHWDHGVDLRGTRSWELPWLHAEHASVAGTEPFRATCTARLADADEELRLTVDRELTVLDTERVPVA